jgi:outer membrane receptor protein involved in Fe transport
VVAAAGGRPVAGAYVVARRQGPGADTAVVASARADTAGGFQLRGLRPGTYTVRVRALSYAPVVRRDVAVAAGGAPVDLGRFELAAVAAQLGEARVLGERDATELAPDRNAFNTRDLPAAAGGTAVDVLRNVPAVEVDGDNNVSLRGNQNVVVQINGRPSPLRGQQLGNFLAQLPANAVAKVEVATNPSAKNDPDGASGVINIVLAQRTDLGTSGGVQAATATTGLANLSGNLGRQTGPWTGFASYGFFRDRRPQVGFNDRFDPSGAGPDGLFATLDGYGNPQFHNATLRGERKFGRFSALSADAVLNGGRFRRGSDAFYRAEDGGLVTNRFAQLTTARFGNANQDYVLAYRRTVDAAKNALTVELRFNDAQNDLRTLIRQQQQVAGGGPSDPLGDPSLASRDLGAQRTPTWRAQSDWTRALAPNTKLEAGVLGIRRRSRSEFERAAEQGDGSFLPDPQRGNRYTYREGVAAIYGVVSRRAGPLELQGGLRLEGAETRFDLLAPAAGTPGAPDRPRFTNRYRSAFPSGLVAYSLDPKRQVKASYSRRISRPDPGQLNPYVQREDALNLFQGNPALRPEYTDAYELGYQQQTRWGSVQLTPYYRRTPDAVRYVRALEADGVTRASFANVALSETYGADLNATLRAAGGRLTFFGGGSAFGARTDAPNVVPNVSFRTGGWSARGNATLKLGPLYDLQGFALYRAPQATEAGRQRRFAMTTFALKRRLRGDAATLTLRATDPFNTMAWGVRTTTGPVVQVIDRNIGARALGLAFNYTFGQAPRLRPPPQSDQPQPAGGAAPGGGPPG